jgi:antitoxin HicB
MPTLGYTIIVEPLPKDEGGGFVVTVPDLPGCICDGATPQEAVANAHGAIKAWIASTKKLGHIVPPPTTRYALAS